MSKNIYIRCPRCELNFILKKDKYCPVCKNEMQALSVNYTGDGVAELGLCPICKVNYITEDETVCSTCMSESDLTEDELDALYGGIVVEKEDVKDDDIAEDDEDLEMITLGQLEGEEGEEEKDEEEEHTIDPLDDFDDSLDDDEEDEDDEEDGDDEDEDEDFGEKYED